MSLKMSENGDISEDDTRLHEISESGIEIKSKIKNFLMENENINAKSIFVHLTSCIKKILEERPNDALDIFEDVSKCIREDKTKVNQGIQDQSVDVGLAEIQKELFKKGEGDDEETVLEEDIESPLPNMMLHAYFYEQAAIGFNREELYRIWLAMKSLVNTQPVDTARFWGKIFGIHQNYYVAEVEFREGEEIEEEAEAVEEERSESREEDEEEMEDIPPKSTWKPPPEIPQEEFRTGANKKVYFVCNEPGKPWIRLPHVTPSQIRTARKIKKVFSGYLEAQVKCWPPFPGLEANLLRTQIARISSGTQISPIGFYTFDNEDEEEAGEEEGERVNYVENTEYVPPRIKELLDPAMGNWVHHTLHILPQGRCSWWNPSQKGEDELEEEEEDDGGQEEKEEAQPEKGPSLLTPISNDVSVGGVEPWSVRISSTKIPEYAVVTVSSNLWPGAHTFAMGRHFQNVYIGWGYKNQGEYSPCATDLIMREFVVDKGTTEVADPTPEEEKALKAAHADGAEEGEEEEEQAEEEEDNN